MPKHITRLAPSPTGALHPGNARTFLVNYLLARQRNWRILMRVEDLDGPRVKAGAAERMLDDLQWLGLSWEEPVVFQSQRSEIYQAALQKLIDSGKAYPCVCSRKDIEQASSAPHADEHVVTYPNTCRTRFASAQHATEATGRAVAWRVHAGDEPIFVCDEFHGHRQFELSSLCGDFVVFRGSGLAAYQLAVVVDDSAAGVDAIVRGDDLLDSAARQIHLRRLLGLSAEMKYWHLPLVAGPDGKRLAKRHGNTRLSYYRQLGATPQRILGLLGYWCGAIKERRETTINELIDHFDISQMSKDPIIFTKDDDKFLIRKP